MKLPNLAALLFGLAFHCLLAGPIGAQEPTTSAGLTEERIPGVKSGTTAFLLSFLGTGIPAAAASWEVYRVDSSNSVVPGVVLVGALLFGPSLGHFYADRPGRALEGVGVRALAGALGTAAFFYWNGIEDSSGTHSNPELGQGLFAVGAALAGVSLAWDIVRAPHSVHIHNDQVSRARAAVGIAPSIGSAGLGLGVQVTF